MSENTEAPEVSIIDETIGEWESMRETWPEEKLDTLEAKIDELKARKEKLVAEAKSSGYSDKLAAAEQKLAEYKAKEVEAKVPDAYRAMIEEQVKDLPAKERAAKIEQFLEAYQIIQQAEGQKQGKTDEELRAEAKRLAAEAHGRPLEPGVEAPGSTGPTLGELKDMVHKVSDESDLDAVLEHPLVMGRLKKNYESMMSE